jgi:hypothetical protein
VIIRMKHIRAAGMCNREPRVFCQRQGWSWQEFLDHGFPEEKLLATGDPMALRVVEVARRMDAKDV